MRTIDIKTEKKNSPNAGEQSEIRSLVWTPRKCAIFDLLRQ